MKNVTPDLFKQFCQTMEEVKEENSNRKACWVCVVCHVSIFLYGFALWKKK